jgi:hypothetical protein
LLPCAEIAAHRKELPRLAVDTLQNILGLRRQIVSDGEQVLVRRSERERWRRERRDEEECRKESQIDA